jgi:hypothetical protein
MVDRGRVDGQYGREAGRKLGPQIPKLLRKRAKGGGRDARHGGRARVPERADLRAVQIVRGFLVHIFVQVRQGTDGRAHLPTGEGKFYGQAKKYTAVRRFQSAFRSPVAAHRPVRVARHCYEKRWRSVAPDGRHCVSVAVVREGAPFVINLSSLSPLTLTCVSKPVQTKGTFIIIADLWMSCQKPDVDVREAPFLPFDDHRVRDGLSKNLSSSQVASQFLQFQTKHP